MSSAEPVLARPSPGEDLKPLLQRVDLAPLRGQRLFITGGTGFVGFWLLSAIACLNELGHGIRVVALSRQPEAFRRRHPELAAGDWLRLVKGDIKSYDTRLGHFDAVVHGAAGVRPEATREPYALLEDILAGSMRVMDHARTAKAKRLLLISSGAVYGELPADSTAFREEMPATADLARPGEAYASGKRAMEALGACLGGGSDIAVVTARLFAFVGPWLPGHLVISQLLADAISGERIALHSDGRPVRSYLYAADLAVWLLVMLAHGQPGRAYNVGSDQGIDLAGLARWIRDRVSPGKAVEILGVERGGPRSRYVPDIARARQELGLEVWTGLERAVALTAGWLSLAGRPDPAHSLSESA